MCRHIYNGALLNARLGRTFPGDGVAEALCAAGANPDAKDDTKGRTLLMWAAARTGRGSVKMLVDAGVCDVDRRVADNDGRTALMIAAARNDLELVGYLVDRLGKF